MARSLNIVIGANIEKLRQGFNDAISVIKKSGGEMSADVAKSAKSIEEKLAAIATKNPTMATVRQLTQLAMEARALGPEFAASADQFIREAGSIKDSIGDARAEVAYFASDTRRLDAVLGAVGAIAGAFGAVEGALALAGVENEDLQKTMVKLQGAIALVNGVQAIQKVLLDENATKTGVLALANRVYTSATAGATGATLAFRTALMSIGIGVVIAGIGALVANFDKLKDAIFPADAALKSLNNTLDKTIAKNKNDIKILEAKGDKLGAFAKQEQNLNITLQKARANFGKNNKENWGEIIDDTKTALLVLKIERENYNTEEAGKQAEHAADVLKQQQDAYNKRLAKKRKFNEELAKLEAQVFGQKNTGKAITNPIEDQIKPEKMEDVINSMEMAAPAVKALNDELVGMGGTEGGPAMVATSVGELSAELQAMADTSSVSYKIHAAAAAEATRKTQEYADSFKEAMSGVNQAFNNMTAQGLEDFGVLLGDIMTGQIGSFQDFGKKLLGAVAAFMKSFGQALIATATASKAFKELLIKNPVLAAAAGVALIAGSAVITNMLNKGPQATAFAEGGIVSGPTLGLVGEYPGASSNPEVIAPLDKLKGMLNTNEQSGYVASTTIQGRDLAIVLERYNKDRNRG
jgi:hypothetical protein